MADFPAITHTTLVSLFSDIASAIRAKKGTTAEIIADEFPSEIMSIPSGGSGGNYNIESVDDGNGGQILNITDAHGGGGLPSGITDIKTGTFTVAEAVTSYTVTHGGATYPKAFLCILENPINRDNSENYSLVVYYYQGFSETPSALSMNSAGYMYTSISTSGIFLRGGTSGGYGATSSTKVEMSAGSGYYFKPTIKNRITTEIEPAVYRWYAIW